MLAVVFGPGSPALVAHTHTKYFMLHKVASYSIVQKISNKQSAKVICRYDRLKIAHRKS